MEITITNLMGCGRESQGRIKYRAYHIFTIRSNFQNRAIGNIRSHRGHTEKEKRVEEEEELVRVTNTVEE